MADASSQADIRGLDIDKLLKGFADEQFILRKYVSVTSTSAREVRWYQKTSVVITATSPASVESDQLALPTVLEQSFTRKTSYVKKWIVESPTLSIEDINDSDIDILATNLRDLTRAVAYQEEKHIYNVLTESDSPSTINSVTTNAAWNTASYTGVNIIEDLMEAKQKIREAGYDPEGAILLLNPLNHKSLLTWLIDGKGSSIPSFASQRVGDGVVMEILGLRVVVSTIVTADKAVVFVPQRAVTLKEFVPIKSAVITDEGIGKKIRVWLESVALLTDPKAVSFIANTDA